MHMLSCLFFVETHFQLRISAAHIPVIYNDLAIDLSRNRVGAFREKSRVANTNPSVIPPSLLQWLFHPGLDWLSPNWMELFNSFVHKE